jgi:chromosome segregation ATPase
MRETVFLAALGIAAFTMIIVVKSIVAAITGRSGARSELGPLKERLEQHAAALEEAESSLAHQSTQIAELQERLDFTERLLAQGRDRSAVGPGKEPQ